MITVTARQQVRPGSERRLDALRSRLMDDIARHEPGCARFDSPRLEDPEPHPFELTAVLSRTEAPFLELIPASGDGIVSLQNCGRILYHTSPDPFGNRIEYVGIEAHDPLVEWARTRVLPTGVGA